MIKFPVRRPSGDPPRAQNSPRTRQLRETRQRRLAYFDNKLRESSDALFDGNDSLQASMIKGVNPVVKGTSLNQQRKSTPIDVRNNLFVLPEKLFPNGPRNGPILKNNVVSESRKSSARQKGLTSIKKNSADVTNKSPLSSPNPGNGEPNGTRMSRSSRKRDSIDEQPSSSDYSVKGVSESQVPPLAINLFQDDESSDIVTPHDLDPSIGILDGDLRLDVKSSPRTVSRLLEPQFEEDFSGLSLSSHQEKVSGLFNGGSDADTYNNIASNLKLEGRANSVYSTVKSSIDDLETSKLEAILGKDRFKRLLKNFEESDWALTSDESNAVTPRSLKSGQGHHGDLDIESVRTDDVESIGQENKTEYSKYSETSIDDRNLELRNFPRTQVVVKSADNPESAEPATYSKSAQDYIRHIKENARFAFSSDEIISQAEQEGRPQTGTKNKNETSKSINSVDQSNQNYKQWMLAELSKSADVALHDLPRSIASNEEPYFQRQSTLDESESEFIMNNQDAHKSNNVATVQSSTASVNTPEINEIQHKQSGPLFERQDSSERHVIGIMQYMQKRELEKNELPEPLPPGHYSSPSLERYFSSLENISNGNVSSQDFDPIQDVEIEETPRNDLKVQGQAAVGVSRPVTTSKSPRHSASVKSTSKKKSTPDVHASKISKNISKTTKPESSREPRKKSEKVLTSSQTYKKDEKVRMSYDTVVTMATEETETSVWGEESSGHRNVFLNKKLKDAASDVTSDFWMKGMKVSGPFSEKDSTSKVNFKIDDSTSRVTKTETDSACLSDSVPASESQNLNASQRNTFIELEKFVVPDQDITTALRNSVSVYTSVENTSTLVTEQGQLQCPDCGEMNKDYLRWCLECGAQLKGEDPVIEVSPRKISQSLENINNRSISLLNNKLKAESLESVKFPKDPESDGETRKHTSATSSLHVAALNPEESFRSRLEHLMASENHGNNQENKNVRFHVDANDVDGIEQERGEKPSAFALKLENEELGESHYFEYCEEELPSSRLSVSLQRELSIDLNLSRSMRRPNTLISPAEEQFVEMSENLEFEYENSVSPSKSLPPDLAEELSLNLEGCLEKSMPTSQFKQQERNEVSLNQSLENEEQLDLGSQNASDDLENYAEEIPNIQIEVSQNDIDNSDDPQPEGHVDLEQGHAEQQENQREEREDLQYEDIPVDDEEGEDFDEETDDGYRIFLEKLRNDPRFRPKSSQSPVASMQGPTTSKGRPQSASSAKYRSSVQSKVRASWDSEPQPRRWEKSAVAWGTYASGELRPRSSVQNIPLKSRSTNSPIRSLSRPSSAKSVQPNSASRPNRASQLRASSAGRVRSSLYRQSMPEKMESQVSGPSPRSEADLLQVRSAPVAKEYKGPRREALGTYDKLLAMSPRVFGGEISYWLCLPDEIWLHILSYLTRQELARSARTCKQLHRVATDDSLWRSICLKKRQRVSDDWLIEIGRRQPTCLALIKCQGERVTEKGLREMFRTLADSLQELNFTGCSRGALTGDHILLHAASRCRLITHLDASWCNVSDNGLVAISEASNRLDVLCVNGCQALTDEAVPSVLVKHGLYLRELELFGCYNLTARSVTSITSNCRGLVSLNLGQCWALSDVSLLQLASSGSVTQLVSLDIQGCKQLKDNAVHMLVRNCPQLRTLSIACCPMITDASLLDIASQGRSLRSLDFHDCTKLTVNGVRAIALGCTQLQFLDVSNTKANHKSVSQLASYCHRELEVLKINCCKDVTVNSLSRLVKNCKKMKKLYLYGVKGIRNIDEVRRANPSVWIEM